MISFGDGATEVFEDMLASIPSGWTVQVVKIGETKIAGPDVCEQDFAFQSYANGVLVLSRVDSNAEPFGGDVTIALQDVEEVHVY